MRSLGASTLLLLVAGCTAIVDPDRARLETDPPCDTDADCDDGVHCNGAEECNGRQCTAGDDPCTDFLQCTLDLCEESTHACSHEGQDDVCLQDPVPQRCDVEEGCVPLPL